MSHEDDDDERIKRRIAAHLVYTRKPFSDPGVADTSAASVSSTRFRRSTNFSPTPLSFADDAPVRSELRSRCEWASPSTSKCAGRQR